MSLLPSLSFILITIYYSSLLLPFILLLSFDRGIILRSGKPSESLSLTVPLCGLVFFARLNAFGTIVTMMIDAN